MNRRHRYGRNHLLIGVTTVGLSLSLWLTNGDFIQRSLAQGKYTEGQEPKALLRTPLAHIPVSTETPNALTSVILLDDSQVTLRRLSLKPHSNGGPYRHPGGYIMLVNGFAFDIAIPLGAEVHSELEAGDILPVAPGNYELNNESDQPLEFVSIEIKDAGRRGLKQVVR